MKKKLKCLVLSAFIIILTPELDSVALFSDVRVEQIGSFTHKPVQSTDRVLSVSSERDIRFIATDRDFNSINKSSDKTHRKIIRLDADVILTDNLIITSDFNLDLNGYTLNLAGYDFTVRHGYFGDIAVFGGTIISTPTGGKLVFDTPNAIHSIPEAVINASLVEYLSFDAVSVKDRVFDFVESELMYGDSGNYYYTDVILPNHYYTYDIEFNYTSGNTAVFSNNGKLLDDATTAAVSFSLTLKIADQLYAKATPITVWAVPLSDTAKWLSIAEELFDNSIAKYYGEDEYYYITSSVLLLDAVTYPGINYSFQTDNAVNLTDGNLLTLTASTDMIILTVTATIGTSEGTPFIRTFKIVADELFYTVVAEAMEYMFPEGSINFVYMTDTYIVPQISGFPGTISFSFLNDATNYTFDNYVIELNTQNPPTMLSQNYLEVLFVFNDVNSTTIKRRVKLNYNPISAGEGGAEDYFYDFYNYLNAVLTERTNGLYTYTSFNMPKAYGSSPKFKYRFVTAYTNGGSYSGPAIISVTDNEPSWLISINITNIPLQDLLITVYYQYTFNPGSELYDEYDQTIEFIIPGIAHSGTNIPDTNLYNAIKSAYCPDQDVLIFSLLSAEKALFEVHNNTITNFKGIEYLVNTSAFNFSGCSFGVSNYTYLSSLDNLTSLNLSGNNITDITAFPLLNNLNTLDISNNRIHRFDRIGQMAGLTTLYVYGQTSVVKPSNDTNASSTAANYGNNGIYNSYNFINASMRGVDIYKADSTTKFVPTADEKTAANVLSGIIYQSTSTNTTNSSSRIPASVTKSSSPTAVFTLTKTVLSEASTSNINGLFVISTTRNGATVYRLLPVTYGALQ